MNDLQVKIDPSAIIVQLNDTISNLKVKLNYEKEMRLAAERKILELEKLTPVKKKTKSVLEKKKEREAYQNRQLTGLKSDGKRISKSATSLSSYAEFKQISDYLLDHRKYQAWLVWSLGNSTGLRISDLTQLKWGFFFINCETKEFRKRFPKIEQKTGKLNDILITEYMRQAVSEYLKFTNEKITPDKKIFESREKFKPNPTLTDEENELRRIKKDTRYNSTLSEALRVAGENFGIERKTSHSMRHTFCDVVNCFYDNSFDLQTLDICSGLLNHSDLKTTMRYCGILQKQMDAAREVVSDFLIGKMHRDKIEKPHNISNKTIYELVTQIQSDVKHIGSYVLKEE